MREIIHTIYDQTIGYYGSATFLVLAVFAGVFLMLTESGRYKKIIIPSIVLVILILNPIAYKFILYKLRFWRLFWMLPCTLIIALTFGELLRKCDKSWKKLVFTFVMILVIILSGRNVFDSVKISKNTNNYRLLQETVDVGELMLQYEDKPKCILSGGLLTSIRLYNADIKPMYGRDVYNCISNPSVIASLIFDEMERAHPNFDRILYHARRLSYSFVVTTVAKPISEETLDKYGYSMLKELDGYYVYYNGNLKEDENYKWSENKKGFFILNKKGKKVKGKAVEVAGCWYYFNKNGFLIEGMDSDTVKNLQPDDLIITQIGKDSYPKPSSTYTIDDQKGHLIIVDGGNEDEYQTIMKTIRQYGSKVDAWILTHPHSDHIGAFNKIYKEFVKNPKDKSKKVEIKKIYAIKLDSDYYHKVANSWDEIEYYDEFNKLVKNDKSLKYVKRGETYKVGDVEFKVYNTYTKKTKNIKTGSLPNAASMVFELFGKNESMLFLADMEQKALKPMVKKYGDQLKADYVQAAHHGQNLKLDFYDTLDAGTVFLDASEWLREGTEDHSAKEHLEYFEEKGMKVYTFATTPNVITLK